jgi:Mu-like prophage protein
MPKDALVCAAIDNMSSLVVDHQDMFFRVHPHSTGCSTSTSVTYQESAAPAAAYPSYSRREELPSSSSSSPESPPISFCAHPIHLHSLKRLVNLSTIFKSRFQICFVCQERISLVAAKEIVTCVACGVFSHRTCLLPLVTVAEEEDECHSFKIIKKKENGDNNDDGGGGGDDGNDGGCNFTNRHGRVVEKCKVNLQLSRNRSKWHQNHQAPPHVQDGFVLTSHAASSHDMQPGNDNDKERKFEMLLTAQQQQQQQQHEWKQSLAKLSRLLHIHNIFTSQGQCNESSIISDISSPKAEDTSDASMDVPESSSASIYLSHTPDGEKDAATMENSKIIMQRISKTVQSNVPDIQTLEGHVDTEQEILTSNILETSQSSMQEDSTREGNVMKGTWQVLQKTNNTRKSLGVASIAGSIAGATAGLIVAGPAGAYVGSKIGQVVGVAGVLIEGTLGVGVLVAGVTGTVLTVKQLQSEEKRLLTIGGNGSEQVVLVRPNVTVDPIWNDITKRARQSAPKDSSGLMEGFALFGDKVVDANKKEREKRDREIALSQEYEINTKEKVFLLVASSLNDKRGLPGYVYRELIGEMKRRAESRKQQTRSSKYADGRQLREVTRETRQDVHGIIKHITATLLEVRPGFCSSPRITELSAMAVETLVFGEIYDAVFEEIREETRQQDKKLEEQFSRLTDESKTKGIDVQAHISHDAIKSIKRLPLYHAVGDKLRCCVELLEFVSRLGTNQNMGADFLLTLVCQHLAVASIPHLNAECAFLEEFAKDEQLLRGKEGYALVTIQASIHFLNASEDIIQDVFLVQD